MPMIVREEVYTDTQIVTLLRQVTEIALSHRGNDTLELIVHTPDGLRVFTSERTVDGWDPDLRRKLKQAVAAF